MPELNKAEIEAYLKSVIGSDTRVLNLKVLGKSEETDIKGIRIRNACSNRL